MGKPRTMPGLLAWVTEAPEEPRLGKVGRDGEFRFRNGGVGLGKPRSRGAPVGLGPRMESVDLS